MAELSSWMAVRGIAPGDLTQPLIEEFLGEAHVQCLGARWCSPTSERELLGYLRELAFVAKQDAVLTDPVDRLLREFAEYLVRERGLEAGSSTVRDYRRGARLFFFGRGPPHVGLVLTGSGGSGVVFGACRPLAGAPPRERVL